MNTIVNARELRRSLGDILNRVQKGERFTVVYRSRLVGQIVPLGEPLSEPSDLAGEPLYHAGPVGFSTDGLSAEAHDELLYDGKDK